MSLCCTETKNGKKLHCLGLFWTSGYSGYLVINGIPLFIFTQHFLKIILKWSKTIQSRDPPQGQREVIQGSHEIVFSR